MTALTDYDRLEASALWRPEGSTQRREVIVSVGEATLTISDLNDNPLSHWSLPAIERVNGTNEQRAIYRPGSDTDERLETEDSTMIDAIARVHRAIDRSRPRPGRLRGAVAASVALAVFVLGVFWLPNALIRQAVQIVPPVTRAEIGDQLFARIQRLSGQPCDTVHGARALARLRNRLGETGRLVVLSSGVAVSQHLPGGTILLNRSLVEDFEDPAVVGGYILAERARASETDPLEALLRGAGLLTSLKLLTTGRVPEAELDAHAEHLLTAPLVEPDTEDLITRFARAEVSATPYAYAIDLTGTTTLPLIEAEGVRIENTRPVLSDSDWVALQGICGA
ncbi:hypothetical protein [Celeribacter arenosi]|uniref:Uncharacterized protein n=1 Tax=Celeribacter arenosi TaxID=792649 RepID=A0ABP7K486_9RHOB